MNTDRKHDAATAERIPFPDSDLPEGWAAARLGEICEPPQYGWTTSARKYGNGLKLLRTSDISGGTVDWSSVPACSDEPEDPAKYLLKDGDIVVSRAGSVGISYLVQNTPKAVFASYLIRFRPMHLVNGEYVAAFLRSPEYWKAIAEESAGIAIPNVNASKLKEIEIPLAPVREQKSIVARIEELLTQVNATRARLAKVAAILRRFRQAVLAAACSGRLTGEWRAENQDEEDASKLLRLIRKSHENAGLGHGGKAAEPTEDVHNLSEDEIPDSWAISDLMWLCEPGRSITYGILKPGPDLPTGVPYIRVADFPNDRLNLSGIRRTSAKIANEHKRSSLRSGDVLLSIRGTVGRVCRVPDCLNGANITQDTARISVHPKVSADYVETYLRCPRTRKRLEGAMKGVAVRGTNIGDVRALQIAVPPLLEQQEIVRRVGNLFRLADTIEKRVDVATKRADKLTQAILAKAFRGELVPTEAELARREGRTYEPASVLLERIRTKRDAGE